MRILVPITCSKEIDILNPDKFHTEFFCGYMPQWWVDRYNQSSSASNISVPLNNRNSKNANVRSREELVRIIRKAKSFHTDVFLALNAKHYPDEAYDCIKLYIDEVISLGVTRMIVCDIGMIRFLRSYYPQIKVSVSCLNQVTNKPAVDFYRRIGNVDRIVFPRHMSSKEIENIARAEEEISFEYFIFSNKCLYDDGYCRGIHEFTPICKDLFFADFYSRAFVPVSDYEKTELRKAEHSFSEWTRNELLCQQRNIYTPNFACSACSLIKLSKLPNIESVKISIRGHGTEELLHQVTMAHQAIILAKNGADRSVVQNAIAKLYGKESLCREGTSCMMV